MKSFIKTRILYSLLAVSLLASACKKTFFTDVNVNPNAPDPSSVVPSVMLSTVEGTLAYTQGGDFSRFSSLITQQTIGAGRQAEGYYQYTFTAVDFDNAWANIYTSVMENNRILMQISDAKNDNAYGGISRILMAYSLQLAVDSWGSIPYSDAFKGENNLQPKFDTDKVLYDSILNLLNTAIAKLGSSDKGPDLPGGEDVLYGGNLSKWVKFAHAIKARLYIHQSKGNPAMAANALAELPLSFTSNDDNAVYKFGSTETSANPWYQFNEQRADIGFDESTLAKKMLASHDPRFDVYIDSSFSDVNQVGMGGYYGDINSPVEFITYDELLFMKAEATITAGGTAAAAQPFYQAAITADMKKLDVDEADITTYLGANGTLPATASAAIAQIAKEEYVALYLNPEAWTLWRRTGSPALTPVTGANVPRRLLYPQTEYSYNKTNTVASTMFTPRVFWDN